MANISIKTLSELSVESTDFVITAIILSKTDPNVFQTKESREFRAVTLFTIRDSKRSITNCKCWGSKEKIEDYHRKFNIHDVINIICPRVVPIRNSPQEEQYQPIVTLPFQLVINEGTGFIEKYIGDIKELNALCKLSIRPLSSVLNLSDINSTNVSFKGHYVDLLVVVAVLKPVKDVRAKSGFPLKVLEMVVLDESLPSGMLLTVWNTGWIERSQQFWKPMKTILHLVDVRVGYSEFHKATTLGFSSRSLVFENPIGKEIKKVAEYAASTPFINMDILLSIGERDSLPNPNSITKQMTIKQIYDHTDYVVNDSSEELTAVLLATVTKFDVDGNISIIARKCKSCGHRMAPEENLCNNDQCQMNFSFNYSGDKIDRFIDINIHFSDHTGTLIETRLCGSVAEQIFGLTAEEFICSGEKQKEYVKWQLLLERVEVKLFLKKKTAVRQHIIAHVVDLKKINLEEFSERIVVY